MRLEDLTVAVRPRNPWESMDLGVAMVRRWWRAVYLPWIAVLWPVALVVALVMPAEQPWAPFLVLWWLKPALDRLVLHVLAHGLFGDLPAPARTLRELPAVLGRSGLGAALTLGRLDPARAFNLPVRQLEGLRGRERRRRLTVLHARARGHAVGLTLIWVHLEALALISLQGLIALMVPGEVDLGADLLGGEFAWQHGLALALYVLAMTVMEPLYVAAGFGLYVGRRTDLEGWDIEIAFRRLAERVAAPGMAVALAAGLLAVLALGAAPPAARAQGQEALPRLEDGAIDHRAVIEAVLAQEAFRDHETVTRWVPKRPEEDEEEAASEEDGPAWLTSLGRLLAALTEALLWLAAGALVVLAVLRRRQLLDLVTRVRREPAGHRPPQVLFGLDLRPESLPEDVAAAAWRQWQAGHHREALSLLYRGTLAAVTRRHPIEVPEGATEGDLLGLAREPLGPESYALLERLTRAWQQLAYAHRPPGAEEVAGLCHDWPAHFGDPPAEARP